MVAKGEIYTMTINELDKYELIKAIIDKKRTAKEVGRILKRSERQVRRLIASVRKDGPDGIKHKNKFNKNHQKYSPELRRQIIDLKQTYNYETCNFTQFWEFLEERENIKISYSSLYKYLREADISSKDNHKARKTHRSRERRLYLGDLIQADGTPHDWFGIGIKYSLHGLIDDATGMIVGLYMCEHECLAGYLEATRQMLENYGIPKQLYPDKHSIFFSSKNQRLTIEEELAGKNKPTTQFGAIMDALGVEMFPASTPQAKGRIERLWETLQDRLIAEFRINNIKTVSEANKFLQNIFIDKYNKRFAVEPKSNENHFIAVPEYLNLDLLLAAKITRVIDNAGRFQIKNQVFQILEKNILPKSKIEIYLSPKIGMKIMCKGKEYHAICFSDIPDSFTNIDLVEYCKQHSAGVMNFVYSLLNENAKQNLPLLTSS